MSKVVFGMTMSLDGFVNDQNGSVSRLYSDLGELQNTEMLQESIRKTGTVVMGRHTYDMANGDFAGYEYQVPIFVLTHDVPKPAEVARGENENFKFHFVTDGIESAVEKAKAAAGDKDVTIVGGANIGQQCINNGLIDELQVDIMPVLLGSGLRLFEHLQDEHIELEIVRVTKVLSRTHLTYRIIK